MTSFAPLPDGGRLAYEEAGTGPPLLLVSGLGGLASFWRGFAQACSARFRVVTYDHRGVGRSSPLAGATSIADMAADLLALLDHLGIAATSLVGHSTGGAIAQHLAIHHPGRLSRLVLSATFARPCPYFQRLFEGRLEILDRLGLEAYRRHAALLLNAPAWVVANAALLDEELATAAASSRPADAAVVRARIAAILAHDCAGDLARIASPTRVVVAADDMVTPPYHARALAAAIPDAELRILPQGGHYAVRAEPQLYREAVLPFLSVEPAEVDHEHLS